MFFILTYNIISENTAELVIHCGGVSHLTSFVRIIFMPQHLLMSAVYIPVVITYHMAQVIDFL